MLKILFLPTMTGSTGCITGNFIRKKKTNNKKIAYCYHSWEMIKSVCKEKSIII